MFMHIEGDEYKTTFNIQNNQFNNNFNESNQHTEKPNLISGAIIATEIHSITNTSLNNNANIFAYDNKDLQVNPLSYVDHYGHTQTKEFPESDFFPTFKFTDSKILTVSVAFSSSAHFSFSDYFTKSDKFSNSLVFSGTNILSESIGFTKSDLFFIVNIINKIKYFYWFRNIF